MPARGARSASAMYAMRRTSSASSRVRSANTLRVNSEQGSVARMALRTALLFSAASMSSRARVRGQAAKSPASPGSGRRASARTATARTAGLPSSSRSSMAAWNASTTSSLSSASAGRLPTSACSSWQKRQRGVGSRARVSSVSGPSRHSTNVTRSSLPASMAKVPKKLSRRDWYSVGCGGRAAAGTSRAGHGAEAGRGAQGMHRQRAVQSSSERQAIVSRHAKLCHEHACNPLQCQLLHRPPRPPSRTTSWR